MLLIINEKPSQARNFAKALGGMKGTFNGEEYQIAALRGHVYEFSLPEEQVPPAQKEDYHKWKLENLPWDETLFSWKRQKISGTNDVIKNVVNLAKTCDEIVIATDVDPTSEGQLLAFEVLLENNIRAKKFTRMFFADESEKEVQKAFKSRKVIPSLLDDSDYNKAYYRARWDMLSMQFSRIATLLGDGKSVLRQGRLKSAMVYIVGSQLDAVKNYKAIPFYSNKFKDENGVVYTSENEPIFENKNDVPNKYSTSSVTVDSKTIKSTAPPKLIDLANLSAKLAPKGFKAVNILNMYQKMYEAQIVSYPRTEDKYITPEQFNDLLPKVDQIAKLVGVNPSILTHRAPRKTHVKTGCAHGANRPGPNVPTNLDLLDAKYGAGASDIYVILAKNFLSMFAEDYEYENQKGHVTNYPDFIGSVNVPKKAGWHAVMYDEDDNDDDSLNNNGLGQSASPFIHEGFPPKPQAPTMKWLMSQLEKRNVGTGATRTSTYADVTNAKSKYPLLKETKGKIDITQFGDMSYRLLPNTHIGSLDLTEKVIADMEAVAKGELNPEVGLHEVAQMVKDDIATMKLNSEKMRKELNLNIMENNNFNEKEKYEGTWKGKEVKFTRQYMTHRFTDEECEALCNGEEIIIRGLKSAKGNTYDIRGRLNSLVYNGHKYIGFERLGFVSDNKFPYKWAEHVFTEDEKIMLEAGKKVHIDGAISKKGTVFSCDVTYEEVDGSMKIVPDFSKK